MLGIRRLILHCSTGHFVASAFLLLCFTTSVRAESNFSQYTGFADYFAANPRSDAGPGAVGKALLARHRPRFFLPEEHAGLISFYDDYIAQGTLVDGKGELVSENVTPEILNRHRNDPAAVR